MVCFHHKHMSKCSQWGRGAQVSHSGGVTGFRTYGVVWKQSRPPAVWHWWYLTSSLLYLESPLYSLLLWHTPATILGLEFKRRWEVLQLSLGDRGEAASSAREHGFSTHETPGHSHWATGPKVLHDAPLPHPRLPCHSSLLLPTLRLPILKVSLQPCPASQEASPNICPIHSASICPASCPQAGGSVLT